MHKPGCIELQELEPLETCNLTPEERATAVQMLYHMECLSDELGPYISDALQIVYDWAWRKHAEKVCKAAGDES